MANKRFVLVGYDVSPSNALGKLAKELNSRGHDTVSFLSEGGKIPISIDQIVQAIEYGGGEGTTVVIGMSFTPAASEAEIAAAQAAMKTNVPFGFLSDAIYCYRREWFSAFREKCWMLFLASEGEISDARTLFPNAKIVATGNPSWEGFVNPELTDERIRSILGIEKDEWLTLVPMNKEREPSLDLAIEAIMAHHVSGKKGVVVIGVHPGAVNNSAKKGEDECAWYETELAAHFQEHPSPPRYLVLREAEMGIKSQDVLRVADVVLSAQSPTTDLQAALSKPGVPVFNYVGHPATKARLMREFGAETPPLCDLGTAFTIEDVADIPLDVFNADNQFWLVQAQRKAFPNGPPLVGTAVGLMVRELFL